MSVSGNWSFFIWRKPTPANPSYSVVKYGPPLASRTYQSRWPPVKWPWENVGWSDRQSSLMDGSIDENYAHEGPATSRKPLMTNRSWYEIIRQCCGCDSTIWRKAMGSTPSKAIRAICWANTKCTVQITTYSHQNLINFIREITIQNKHPLCQIWVGCWRERFPIADVDFNAVWRACLGHYAEHWIMQS